MAEREFPIMGWRTIPWSLIAPYELAARKNHHQSLERLAERGGLDPAEAVAVFEGRPWGYTIDRAEAIQRLQLRIDADLTARLQIAVEALKDLERVASKWTGHPNAAILRARDALRRIGEKQGERR